MNGWERREGEGGQGREGRGDGLLNPRTSREIGDRVSSCMIPKTNQCEKNVITFVFLFFHITGTTLLRVGEVDEFLT